MKMTPIHTPGPFHSRARRAWHRLRHAPVALCLLSACLLVPLLPDARAQSENPPDNIPAFSLFVAPTVANREDRAPYTGPVVPPEAPVLLAEGADSPGDGGSQPLSTLPIGLRLDSKVPLAELDWVLMEVVLQRRSVGLVSANTQGTPPMAHANYVLGRDASSRAPRIDYTTVTFVLTRDHPDADPVTGELLLYTVLFRGSGVTVDTVETVAGAAALDTVSSGVLSDQCRARSESAQVPLIRGDDISIGTSDGFVQSDNSVIFDSYGPIFSSVNNNDDFHGDQVFTLTARVACGSATFAGAPLVHLLQSRPEHSLVVRMRDDDVPRVWFDPALSSSERLVFINEDGTPGADNRLPGLINAANATRYALVSADSDRRLQPNYSTQPLNVRVGMTERNAEYGEDFVFLDADGEPIPEADLGSDHDIDVQVPPGRATFSMPLEIVDDQRYELRDDIFWGFRSDSNKFNRRPFPYIPAPANSEGYRVVTSRLSDDLFAGGTTVGVMNVDDNDILRIAHEAVPPILLPAESTNRITATYGFSYQDSVQGVTLPRVNVRLSLGSTDEGETPLSSCRNAANDYLCEFSSGSLGNRVRFIDTNRRMGEPPGEFFRVGGISTRRNIDLAGASVTIRMSISLPSRVDLAPPLVLRPLQDTPLVTVIAIPAGSSPPAAGTLIDNERRIFTVDEPNPAADCPAPEFYGDGFSQADCVNPAVRLDLYAVLLGLADAAPTSRVVTNNFGSVSDPQGAAVAYSLPEDDDYTWTPGTNTDGWFIIQRGRSSVRLGTLEIEADDLMETDEFIHLRAGQHRDVAADLPDDTRIAAEYLDLPERLRTIEGFDPVDNDGDSIVGIIIRDADSYMYSPLVHPVISTIREDDPDGLPVSIPVSPFEILLDVPIGATQTKTIQAYHLQSEGYRGMPFGAFGGDTWQIFDRRGASRTIKSDLLADDDDHYEFPLADAREQFPGFVRYYSGFQGFNLPNICDFTDCSASVSATDASWLRGQHLIFPLPAAGTVRAAFTMYYQRQFIRNFWAELSTQLTTHGEDLAKRITADGSLNVRMRHLAHALGNQSSDRLYSPNVEFRGGTPVAVNDRVTNGRNQLVLDYIGKTELEFHFREGGALDRAMGERLDLGGGVIRQSRVTVLGSEVPRFRDARPRTPDTPLTVASGSTLRYTFRAPPGLTMRFSVFATGGASESVLGPAGGGLIATSPTVLPVALYADADPNRELMRAEIVPYSSQGTEALGRRGHSTLYLGFMEQGNTPAHLDFATLQCNSDPVRFSPAIDNPRALSADQMGYYASVPHSGAANALASYTLEIGIPPLRRQSVEILHEPFLSIASAIHCVRSHVSDYRNLHSLKCSDTREAITNTTPPGVCDATTQTVTLDIARSLAVNTLGFSGFSLVEGSFPRDAVAIELLPGQSLVENLPDTEMLEWTLQFDDPDPRLRYDGNSIPSNGRLTVAFTTSQSATRYGGARFFSSAALLTLQPDEQIQPPRLLTARPLDVPGAASARSASLLLTDETTVTRVFGVRPESGRDPAFAMRGPIPTFLRLRFARVPTVDTEVRGSFTIENDISDPCCTTVPFITVRPLAQGSVMTEQGMSGSTPVVTYNFSAVFPAGRQEVDALSIERFSERTFATTVSFTLDLKSAPGFPLEVVSDADQDLFGLRNSFILTWEPLEADSITLPNGIGIASPVRQRAEEGATASYEIAAAVGTSVRIRTGFSMLPFGLRRDYEGRDLVWSVGTAAERTRLAREVFAFEDLDVYITFHSPDALGDAARASCARGVINRQNELLVPHTANTAVANYRINLELLEDGGDYYGAGDDAMAVLPLRQDVVCVSDTVGQRDRVSPIVVRCDSDAIAGNPQNVCRLSHLVDRQINTVTVTIDDNDARIERIELVSSAPEGSPLRTPPPAITEPLPGGPFPAGHVIAGYGEVFDDGDTSPESLNFMDGRDEARALFLLESGDALSDRLRALFASVLGIPPEQVGSERTLVVLLGEDSGPRFTEGFRLRDGDDRPHGIPTPGVGVWSNPSNIAWGNSPYVHVMEIIPSVQTTLAQTIRDRWMPVPSGLRALTDLDASDFLQPPPLNDSHALAEGTTVAVTLHLPGTNQTPAPLALTLQLRPDGGYARRVLADAAMVGNGIDVSSFMVPAGAASTTTPVVLSIPSDDVYHNPGRLRLADGSANALSPPESAAVRLLDFGDGYHEFTRETVDSAVLSETSMLSLRVRLLSPAAEDTTVRITFATAIHMPAGTSLAEPDDFTAEAGAQVLPGTLARTMPTNDSVRDTLTLRFPANTQEAEALRIGFGSSFHTGLTGITPDRVTIEMPGPISELLSGEVIMVPDEVTGEARTLRTQLSVGSVSGSAEVVVEAPNRSFLEGSGSDALFSISVLPSDGMPIAYPASWTLELDLDDPRDVFLEDTLGITPASVSTMTRSGTGPGATVLTLTVPANTSSPITIGGNFAPTSGGILHGPRTLSATLRTVTDVASFLEIPSGRGSTASVTVTDADLPLVDLSYPVGTSRTVVEGEETVLNISVVNSTSSADTNFRTASDNPGPIVVGVLSVYRDPGDSSVFRHGGSCASPVAMADLCIHLEAAAELGSGVRWTFRTFGEGDDARAYPVLTMDPGSTLQSTTFERVITVRALEDMVLELDERVRLAVVIDPRFLGRDPEDLRTRDEVGRAEDFTIGELAAPGRPFTDRIPAGDLFYSMQPLVALENSSTATAGLLSDMHLVNAAGEPWLYTGSLSPNFILRVSDAAEPRGFSAAELTTLVGRFRARFRGPASFTEIPSFVRIGAFPTSIPVLLGDDANAINEIAFFEVVHTVNMVPVGNPIPPHPTLGMAGGTPALRLHFLDDDEPFAVELQRYELDGSDNVVPASGFGLDDLQVQGAAAFVDSTVDTGNPLFNASRRSGFGVLFAPGRDAALPSPFGSGSRVLRTGGATNHYVVLALSVGGIGSTSFDYQTIDSGGTLGSRDAGFAADFMDLRVGSRLTADGTIGAAPRNYSGTASDAHLLLITNDANFRDAGPTDAGPVRAELRRICPVVLAEAGLTTTSLGVLNVPDANFYNDRAFHLVDADRNGSYYGFRENAASVEVQLLCASDPSLSPDLTDNSRPDGSRGAEFCATRMRNNRCLFNTSGDQLDYQNFLPGFHDDSGTVPLTLSRDHTDILVEPDAARAIADTEARTRFTLTVENAELTLHADYGGTNVPFIPRAHRPGAATNPLQLELTWSVVNSGDALAAEELDLSAPVTDAASTSRSLLVSLIPAPSGNNFMLDVTVAARADDFYEHCVNHRLFADLGANLGFLDRTADFSIQINARRNLCQYTDAPDLDVNVRTLLRQRGREPTFRLLPRLHYRDLGPGLADAVLQQTLSDNAVRVQDSDSYARLIVSNTELSEDDTGTAVDVQVQFGGDADGLRGQRVAVYTDVAANFEPRDDTFGGLDSANRAHMLIVPEGGSFGGHLRELFAGVLGEFPGAGDDADTLAILLLQSGATSFTTRFNARDNDDRPHGIPEPGVGVWTPDPTDFNNSVFESIMEIQPARQSELASAIRARMRPVPSGIAATNPSRWELMPVDLALLISGDAERLGIRYSGDGVSSPVVVPNTTANADLEITLVDPSTASARSFDPLALRGMWLNPAVTPGDTTVDELLLFGEDAGTSRATRYDLTRDNSGDPVLGNLVSIVRLRGLVPMGEPIDVMRIAALDDDVVEGADSFTLHLGILSASQGRFTPTPDGRSHSQRVWRGQPSAQYQVDTSLGIERSYTAAYDDLRAAGRSVRTDVSINIADNDVPNVFVRDNTGTVIIRENNLSTTTDPEGDDLQEVLSTISIPGLTAPDGDNRSGSGALLRIDLESPSGDHHLPLRQEYQVLYHYTVPTARTERHQVDVRGGASVYLLLGEPDLVEAGESCADRVSGLGTGNKPLIKAGEHPSTGGSPLDIRDQLPDGGLGARLFFSARDTSSNFEWFQGEGLFSYSVTLLCSDSSLYDPDNPATDIGTNFCVSGGAAPNLVANDPVDGGAACTAHESRDYAVRDTNYVLGLSVSAPPGGSGSNNVSSDLVASYDEPDAARSAIGRAAIPVVSNLNVGLDLYHRVTGQAVDSSIFSGREGRTRYELPDLDAIFVTPFSGREGGAPFTATANPNGLPTSLPEDESSRWFSFSTRENDHIDGADRVVELSLPLGMLPTMRARVVHLVIDSGLTADAPGYTDFVVGSEFSATLRLRDSDNYYYYLSDDDTGLRVFERHDDSAAAQVMVAFGATALGQAILDADPLAGDGIGMRIERLVGDASNIASKYQPATLSDLRLHNIDTLPGSVFMDPSSSEPPPVPGSDSIPESDIMARDDTLLVQSDVTPAGHVIAVHTDWPDDLNPNDVRFNANAMFLHESGDDLSDRLRALFAGVLGIPPEQVGEEPTAVMILLEDEGQKFTVAFNIRDDDDRPHGIPEPGVGVYSNPSDIGWGSSPYVHVMEIRPSLQGDLERAFSGRTIPVSSGLDAVEQQDTTGLPTGPRGHVIAVYEPIFNDDSLERDSFAIGDRRGEARALFLPEQPRSGSPEALLRGYLAGVLGVPAAQVGSTPTVISLLAENEGAKFTDLFSGRDDNDRPHGVPVRGVGVWTPADINFTPGEEPPFIHMMEIIPSQQAELAQAIRDRWIPVRSGADAVNELEPADLANAPRGNMVAVYHDVFFDFLPDLDSFQQIEARSRVLFLPAEGSPLADRLRGLFAGVLGIPQERVGAVPTAILILDGDEGDVFTEEFQSREDRDSPHGIPVEGVGVWSPNTGAYGADRPYTYIMEIITNTQTELVRAIESRRLRVPSIFVAIDQPNAAAVTSVPRGHVIAMYDDWAVDSGPERSIFQGRDNQGLGRAFFLPLEGAFAERLRGLFTAVGVPADRLGAEPTAILLRDGDGFTNAFNFRNDDDRPHGIPESGVGVWTNATEPVTFPGTSPFTYVMEIQPARQEALVAAINARAYRASGLDAANRQDLSSIADTASGIRGGFAHAPFNFAADFNNGRMRLFDIGAARDRQADADEALDLTLDLRFLGRPAAGADFGLHAEPSRALNMERSSVGTALPIVIPFEAQSPYAAVHVNTDTRLTNRYLPDGDSPRPPTLVTWSFSDLSLPDAPLLLAVDFERSDTLRNVFSDRARVGLARGDGAVPEPNASVGLRHCVDGEERCQNRLYRVYLQLGPYTGDDDIVLRAVTADATDPNLGRRAACAANLDRTHREAPYLVANVLKNPVPSGRAYNDSDDRYQLSDGGRGLRLVLSDDGISSAIPPMLEGADEERLYGHVGVGGLRFSVLCSDDPDYTDDRALEICGGTPASPSSCAMSKEAPLVLRGPAVVYRFAMTRNDANPLFITDPVLGLREPDAPAADPLTERFDMLTYPERNQRSAGSELHIYATLASGPTVDSGANNQLAPPSGGTPPLPNLALRDSAASAVCLPRGQNALQNPDGTDPGDAVIGDCALSPRVTNPPTGSFPPGRVIALYEIFQDSEFARSDLQFSDQQGGARALFLPEQPAPGSLGARLRGLFTAVGITPEQLRTRPIALGIMVRREGATFTESFDLRTNDHRPHGTPESGVGVWSNPSASAWGFSPFTILMEIQHIRQAALVAAIDARARSVDSGLRVVEEQDTSGLTPPPLAQPLDLGASGVTYAGMLRVLDDNRWEPIAAGTTSTMPRAYPGQDGYYVPGDALGATANPARRSQEWLQDTDTAPFELSSPPVRAPRLARVAYPSDLFIRDAEATLWLSFDESATMVDGVAYLDHNELSPAPQSVRIRLNIGSATSTGLPLGLAAGSSGGVMLRLPAIMPTCQIVRRSINIGSAFPRFISPELEVFDRAPDGTETGRVDFPPPFPPGRAFTIVYSNQEHSNASCPTPWSTGLGFPPLLPAQSFDGLRNNPLFFEFDIPLSFARFDPVSDYEIALLERNEEAWAAQGNNILRDIENIGMDALYRLYDAPGGDAHARYPRTLRMRIGDATAPVVCAGSVAAGTSPARTVNEVLSSARNCLEVVPFGPYVIESTWTLAVDHLPGSQSDSNSNVASRVFRNLDTSLPAPVDLLTDPPVPVDADRSDISPYSLHYYALTPGQSECERIPSLPHHGLSAPLPAVYAANSVGAPVAANGDALLSATFESPPGLRAGRTHCAVLAASDGANAAYTNPVQFTTAPYDVRLDENNNGIPDHAEFASYNLPDSTDTTVVGDAYAQAYCDTVTGGTGYDPDLSGRNDCDQDGVPDVVELALGAPGSVSPMADGNVRTVMCFAASVRTRLPLPTGGRLQHCAGAGSALLASPSMSGNWRIMLDDTTYRGLGYTLDSATASGASGPNAGGLLPASYWLVDPGVTGLVNLVLLPRIELDVPPLVPVFTRFEYVDGGLVTHYLLVNEPPERQVFTHRGELYLRDTGVPGFPVLTFFYAITENSLDPELALSLPQAAALRLFGSSAGADALSYQVQLQRDPADPASVPVPLGPRTALGSGAIGANRALVADVPLVTSSDLTFGPGAQQLRVVLRARAGTLELERSLDADVEGVLQPGDDLDPLRAVSLQPLHPEVRNPLPFGYPPRYDVTWSESFYANASASTPRGAPVVHFSRPQTSTDSATVFTLNVHGLRSRQYGGTRVRFEVLNYATGRVAELVSSHHRRGPDDGLNPTPGDIFAPQDISTEALCTALGGCDFEAEPFHLFELSGEVFLDTTGYTFERDAGLLPLGDYQLTHNRDGTGSVNENVTITEATARPRVTVQRTMAVMNGPVIARVAQTVQFGGPVPGDSADPASYADADYDGVPDSSVSPADVTRLVFAVGRSDRPDAALYGSIQTPVLFARAYLGSYGRAGYLRAPDVSTLPLLGANVGATADPDGNLPDYPSRGGNALRDFALDFSLGCDARRTRAGQIDFGGAPAPTGSTRSVSVDPDCLGELTPVLLTFPAGAIVRGVFPAQALALGSGEQRSGFNQAPTELCGFIPGNVRVAEDALEARAGRGCPPVSATDGVSADTGDSFAFAPFTAAGACPDVYDQGQWPRINAPAQGGERCLRLLISDNGPNDAARFRGVIADPLVWSPDADFLAPSAGGGTGPSRGVVSAGSGGGGIVDLWSLLALLTLTLLFGTRLQRPLTREPARRQC